MKPKILLIVGPTASGKKSTAFKAAEMFGGEIISADSRKVYRYLDIGTAKPSCEARENIHYHLIDIVNPDEPFSAGEWVLRASEAVNGVLSRGRLPIISGGTGFYVKAFKEGLTEGISPNPEVRETLTKELAEKGAFSLYRKLVKIDPKRAAELHENDSFRIMRALEVFFTTGKTFTAFRENNKISGGDYDYFTIGTAIERNDLYKYIDKRADDMISKGLLDELKAVLNMGYSRDLTALDTVGYKEWFPYLDGKMTFEACLEQMKRNTRQYAKRQLTWFRAVKEIQWIDPTILSEIETKFKEVELWLT